MGSRREKAYNCGSATTASHSSSRFCQLEFGNISSFSQLPLWNQLPQCLSEIAQAAPKHLLLSECVFVFLLESFLKLLSSLLSLSPCCEGLTSLLLSEEKKCSYKQDYWVPFFFRGGCRRERQIQSVVDAPKTSNVFLKFPASFL